MESTKKSTNSNTACRDRRIQILKALSVTPLDAKQLITLSQSWELPFYEKDNILKVMRRLEDKDWVKDYKHEDGSKYWRLTKIGAAKVFGKGNEPKKESFYRKIKNEHHARRLADVIVKLLVNAHQLGIEVEEVYGDRQVTLTVEKRPKLPDAKLGFVFKHKGKKSYYRLVVELDCNTEWGYTAETEDSLNRMIEFYLDHRNATKDKYYWLMVFDTPTVRVRNFLDRLSELNRQPNQRFVKTTTVDQILQRENPLQEPFWLDYDKQVSSLLPGYQVQPEQIAIPNLDMAAVA